MFAIKKTMLFIVFFFFWLNNYKFYWALECFSLEIIKITFWKDWYPPLSPFSPPFFLGRLLYRYCMFPPLAWGINFVNNYRVIFLNFVHVIYKDGCFKYILISI